YRFIEEEAVLQVRSDRHTHRPYGLAGGYPGKPSASMLDPDGEARPLPPKLTMTIRQGQVFRHDLPGAGGWGDPLLREPEAVLRDVRNEFVSIAAARALYGVVILADPLRVDAEATAWERRALADARGWQATPRVLREPPAMDGAR
ncbi:MAG: hydantoinase B/oxoprolinase family protein, partial [Alphaproteobacteria bacterium]|nr:hydantoinase B/oxoprolinase family protein [Alphaproteobacteria bacterium]